VTIIYVVLSHRNPGQVLRLVRALREGPSAQVLVRHDQRRSRLRADEVDAAGGTLVVDRVEVEWARWSHVEVMLDCMRKAARLAPDWTLVLSGQDYPLRPPAEIEARLAETEADALLGSVRSIEAARPPAREDEEFFLRTAYHHFRRPRRLPRLPRAARPIIYVRDLPPLVGVRRPRPIRAVARRPDLRLYASADWLTLGRRALEAMLAAADDRALMRAFRRVAVPSESLFATVLLNDETLTVERDNRRFAAFPGPGTPHPATLTSADVEAALASGADFGRKFDVRVDGRVLDLLDARRRSAQPR
jgi:hypothetical protein